ncbi:hypothetical protein CBOM_07778 [Ceraceosorus bombacis]|uniref:Uncharacterized protein n=1 Tax=Ceraceosorus bombacis TaxID=401625 RepID=A0A0P1BMH6_9BASI|nr:hypothetical protein CBOM_07778 [Ceraceosorus bombacis]
MVAHLIACNVCQRPKSLHKVANFVFANSTHIRHSHASTTRDPRLLDTIPPSESVRLHSFVSCTQKTSQPAPASP